ncbi:MAG: FAD-dependent thymidylate synthase [Deltaproteobacteria bacterium]|nr:FAD-dependent thymidylate synthase [Deltaproteobacteria bacterium]
MEPFSPAERERLAPFFTNVDRPVFGLRLPQEVAGALFSRYSRSARDLRRTFLDEFLGEADLSPALGTPAPAAPDDPAVRRARAFYDRVLVGYGDDSVAQLGGAHVACEDISNVAAKVLEDARIGMAPLEKSTRYVRFDRKDASGRYLYYVEPTLDASPHRRDYLELMELLFDSYSRQMEPVIEHVRKSLPLEETELRNPQTGDPISYAEARKDEKLARWAESAYRSTVRAHACDILRGYLPAATRTNVGLFGVGQAYEYLLSKCYSSDLAEMRDLGSAMRGELDALIPSFVKRARASAWLSDTFSGTRALARELVTETARETGNVTLVDYDDQAEERVIAAILYPHTRQPLSRLRELAADMPEERRQAVLDAYMKDRRHRREKPGRALEQVFYTFDIIGNLGIYRDLQRHRLLTQERQDFSTAHGYDTPPEIVEAGFGDAYRRCMERAAAVHDRIHADHPREAQYVVPFAYRVRWYMKMNLREAVHIGELRTLPQGHPDYRDITQKMWREIGRVHPRLAGYAKFIDWKTYRLGRLASELRTEFKKSGR